MRHFFFFLFVICIIDAAAQDSLSYTQSEIIYGRKDGMALTMVKVAPKLNSNGKAIIELISGNWVSSYRGIEAKVKGTSIYTKRGYTVFLVIHGSQPRYTIPDALSDVKRAVRFIKYNAKDYAIDSSHIGITGYSSGGNLSLLTALTDDEKEGSSQDPIDKVSSRVHAAGVFFPPTDFFNFGGTKFSIIDNKKMLSSIGVAAAFDFKTYDAVMRMYKPASDSMVLVLVKQVSPIYAVSSDDPPTLIIHGDADKLVPLQQSQIIIEKLKEAKVPNELMVIKGRGHGWMDMSAEKEKVADWFDKYLK